MARTSLSAAKTELYNLFAADANGTPVASLTKITQVFDHEPKPGELPKPMPLTVSTAEVTPDEWVFAVRIYATGDVDAAVAQDDLDTAIEQVDAVFTAGFGPSAWTIGWIPEIEAFVATGRVGAGRQDF